MNKAVMFSTGKDNWETPQSLFLELDDEFHFTLDAAADRTNHKTDRWYGPGGEVEDALSVEWPTNEIIWLNPPYSRGAQRRFVNQAVDAAQRGGTVVALLPARTDTRLFHQTVWDTKLGRPRRWVRDVRFLAGRVRFIDAQVRDFIFHRENRRMTSGTCGAPFPSMIVVFQKPKDFDRWLDEEVPLPFDTGRDQGDEDGC